jgi:hypothetical protein
MKITLGIMMCLVCFVADLNAAAVKVELTQRGDQFMLHPEAEHDCQSLCVRFVQYVQGITR